MDKIKLDVEGMKGHVCATRITRRLNGMPGIKTVTVDLNAKTVTVEGFGLDRKTLSDTIISLGFDVALPA